MTSSMNGWSMPGTPLAEVGWEASSGLGQNPRCHLSRRHKIPQVEKASLEHSLLEPPVKLGAVGVAALKQREVHDGQLEVVGLDRSALLAHIDGHVFS